MINNSWEGHKRIEESITDNSIHEIMITIDYLNEMNIKLRKPEYEELRNKRGPLYSLILYEYRKQKIEKIISKNENSINN